MGLCHRLRSAGPVTGSWQPWSQVLIPVRPIAETAGEKFDDIDENGYFTAGVDTVKELRNRNPESLATKMAEVNASRKLVRMTPSATSVGAWVAQAQALQPKVSH